MNHLCVIGDPVDHSLSPVMHNAAIGALGLEREYAYGALRVSNDELGSFIGSMRNGSVAGASVTMPHKEAVLPFLDDISGMAGKCRAVNTVTLEKGIVTGHNTDGEGCVNALREAGAEPEGRKVVILGAGGAARAIAFALCDQKVQSVHVINRSEARARMLADSIGSAAAIHGGEGKITEAMQDADIIINATSAGMIGPAAGQSPVPSELIGGGMTVMDIVYQPLETRLLTEARMAGARTVDGLGMLVHQGAIQFELFTGKEAPVNVMREAILEILSEE